MAAPRSGATAVALLDGRILIIGGSGPSGPLATAEIYQDGTFAEAAPMSVARTEHAAVRLFDGRVLVAGGKGADGQPTFTAEIFDPANNSWTPAGGMAKTRFGHTATRLGTGHVLIAGGQSSGVVTDSLEVFDPATEKFSELKTSLSSPRIHHAAVGLPDRRVLLIGGDDGRAVLSSIDIYNTNTGAISRGPELSTARTSPAATSLLNGDVLIVGGSNGRADLASAEVFDLSTGQMTKTKGALSTPRSGLIALRLPDNNSVLLIGGASGGQPVASAELYRPWIGNFRFVDRLKFWQSAFTPTTPPREARGRLAAEALTARDEVVVMGGDGRDAAERYAYATVQTDRKLYGPDESVMVTGSGWNPGETLAIRIAQEPQARGDRTIQVVADELGRFSADFKTDPSDRQIDYYITTSGTGSQAQAALRAKPIANQVACPTQSPAAVQQLRCVGKNPGDTCAPPDECDHCSPDVCNTLNVCDVDAFGPVNCGQCRACVITDPVALVAQCDADLSQNNAPCDDTDPCTTGDTCQGGLCQGTPTVCTPPDQCHTSTCDATTGNCVVGTQPDGFPCNDGNACTTPDTCQGGQCTGTQVNCDDNNPCTTDTCDPVAGCQNTPVANGTACSDNNVCTANDTCQGGVCTGTPVNCDDNNQCTNDTCDPVNGCMHQNVPNGTLCNDNKTCTSPDTCQNGVCQGSPVTGDTGKAAGGGRVIASPSGREAHFGFHARKKNSGRIDGHFDWVLYKTNTQPRCRARGPVTSFARNANEAIFSGTCREISQCTSFCVKVKDLGEGHNAPPDTIEVTFENGSCAGTTEQPITHGNINVKPATDGPGGP